MSDLSTKLRIPDPPERAIRAGDMDELLKYIKKLKTIIIGFVNDDITKAINSKMDD